MGGEDVERPLKASPAAFDYAGGRGGSGCVPRGGDGDAPIVVGSVIRRAAFRPPAGCRGLAGAALASRRVANDPGGHGGGRGPEILGSGLGEARRFGRAATGDAGVRTARTARGRRIPGPRAGHAGLGTPGQRQEGTPGRREGDHGATQALTGSGHDTPFGEIGTQKSRRSPGRGCSILAASYCDLFDSSSRILEGKLANRRRAEAGASPSPRPP